jgi:2-polyprenyl-3-methyl-5-hydroxy-6-metoxy-1,4-benzoquinol methylase
VISLEAGCPDGAALSDEAIRRRIAELGPWYQNIDLGRGIHTKDHPGSADIFPGADIPRPLWDVITRDLGDLDGARVLDVGCNAGFMSFEAKRLGAAHVLGVDSDVGATTSFIAQAEFCREVLGLDVEFQQISFFDLEPAAPFDVILFCGVLYHLEDFAGGLDKVQALGAPGGRIVLETASEPVTRSTYGTGYHGDPTTFFVPSMRVLLALVEERGLRVEVARDLGTRALLFLRLPAG